MKRILFYFQYAARNLWRSRRWSTFAVFSVAAGVATVVALRSLGLAVGDSLTNNLRATNHGDITVSMSFSSFFSFRDPQDEDVFSQAQAQRAQAWIQERGGRMAAYTSSGNVQISALDFTAAGRPQFISSIFIDPETYPPTADIFALDPPGVPLGQLFQGGNEVVISQNLAESQDIQVGDYVRVSGTEEEFVVRGIVPTTAEAGLRNLFAAFFGFAYFDRAQAGRLPVPEEANALSFTLPGTPSPAEIEQAADDVRSLLSRGGAGFFRITTVPQLLEQNQRIADVLGSFIVIMGLGALLIGGVGIMNTMLVLVRRRTEEIAALKTFGLKGRQVAMLFMAEALLLGVLGSLVGGVFGVLLSGLANAYGSTLIQQPLTWRLYPEAVLFGLALGVIVTGVFGVLPVLTAVKVRPGIILRPNETHIPRVGVFNSLLALALVVVSIGLIAGQIMAPTFAVVSEGPRRVAERMAEIGPNPYVLGIIGVAGTLLILGILIGLLWIVVWLVGKLPSFGWVDLRLALRNLATRRLRTATTLLALSAGMFALSSIAFVGAGVREILQQTLTESLGGNVMIIPVLPPPLAQTLINGKLNQLGDKVQYRTRLQMDSGVVVAVDGVDVDESQNLSRREIQRQINEAARAGDYEKVNALSEMLSARFVSVMIRDTDNPRLTSGELLAGRGLTQEDRGRPVTVAKLTPLLAAMGVEVGSTITLRLGDETYDFEVVGLRPDSDVQSLQDAINTADFLLPVEVVSPSAFNFTLNVIQVQPELLNEVLLDLSSLPLIYSLDVTFIDGLLRRLLDQMSAIPILVGLLSLGAAAVIMANTVALATLERRRQIGILKAVGLKGQRVLRIMLLENTMVSLLGGVLGIGLSALGVVIMTSLGLELAILVPADAMPVAIALVVAAVFIGWLATVLSARVAVGERVMNVLRYE